MGAGVGSRALIVGGGGAGGEGVGLGVGGRVGGRVGVGSCGNDPK